MCGFRRDNLAANLFQWVGDMWLQGFAFLAFALLMCTFSRNFAEASTFGNGLAILLILTAGVRCAAQRVQNASILMYLWHSTSLLTYQRILLGLASSLPTTMASTGQPFSNYPTGPSLVATPSLPAPDNVKGTECLPA